MTLPPSQLSAEYDNNRHTHHNNRCFFHLYVPGSIAANKTMLKYDRCNKDYNRKNNTDSHVITNQKDVNTPQECSAECVTKGVFCLCFLLIHRDIGSMQGTVCIGRFRIDFYYAKTGTG